jgi:tetratricopeptide (TPR) repeat protein
MSWKISIYEEPGVLLAVRQAEPEPSLAEQAQLLLKGGLEQGRKVLALVESSEDPCAATIYPQSEPSQASFEELTDEVQTLLGNRRAFDAVLLMDSALRGPHGENPEVWMLAASVYELVRFFPLAAPLLERSLPKFDGLREAAAKLRLARAWARMGRREGVAELVRSGLTCEELPPTLKIEGLLLLSMTQPREEALETLDELLDQAEEHLGDHRLAAEALELHADLVSEQDAQKAQQFYLAAGKMLLRLQDPYFFSLNERLVVHHLKHREMQNALSLSQEMFQLLKQSDAPAIANVPFLVFAAWVHEQMGDKDRQTAARQTALGIDPNEVARVEANLQRALSTEVKS